MKPVLILQHMAAGAPGHFAEFLEAVGIPYRVLRVDQGEALPADADGCSGICLMGGVMSANDPLPWIAREIELVRAAQAHGQPVIGHCLGGQIIARALGGEVAPHDTPEVGWHGLEPVPGPVTEAWLPDGDETLAVMQWHYERFTVPPGATPILSSQHCDNQAFVVGRTLALQCHPEVTEDMARHWASLADALPGPPPSTTPESLQTPGQILEGIRQGVAANRRLAWALYGKWVEGL